MVKKFRNREKPKPHKAKPKFTLQANLFEQQHIKPCLKQYRQAMKTKRYEEAGKAFAKLQTLRKEHRLLLARKEKIRLR